MKHRCRRAEAKGDNRLNLDVYGKLSKKPSVSDRRNFSGAERAVGVIRSRNEGGEGGEGCDPDEKQKKKPNVK